MEPTTVAACDAALADLRLRLRVAEAEDNAAAWVVLTDRCDHVLDMRLALTKPRVKVGAP
jgi:hypothetical protein